MYNSDFKTYYRFVIGLQAITQGVINSEETARQRSSVEEPMTHFAGCEISKNRTWGIGETRQTRMT